MPPPGSRRADMDVAERVHGADYELRAANFPQREHPRRQSDAASRFAMSRTSAGIQPVGQMTSDLTGPLSWPSWPLGAGTYDQRIHRVKAMRMTTTRGTPPGRITDEHH